MPATRTFEKGAAVVLKAKDIDLHVHVQGEPKKRQHFYFLHDFVNFCASNVKIAEYIAK